MNNNNNSLSIALLVLLIILCIILFASAGLFIYKRIISKHKNKNDSNPLDKEIKKLKETRQAYKQKLASVGVDTEKDLLGAKEVVDAEIEDYKNERILAVNQDIEKHKNEILRKTILNSMQPLHLKLINESSVVYIPVDEKVKPLIIGKKGQNIKKLNELTYCNINIDKNSPYIEISSNNPIDRTIAINTINHLIKSEAFDLIAISNVFKKETNLIRSECIKTGKEYLNALNIQQCSQDLCEYVGRLKFRWSFSQNVLQHCYEVALICEQLAKDFNLDPQIAKECGFFHDVGKAIDYESKYNHIDSGIKIAKECNLNKEIVNVILKHHRTNCNEDYVLLVRCADAWSAARIGARHYPHSSDDKTITIIEQKIKSIEGIASYKINVVDNAINILLIPKFKNKQVYEQLKFKVFRAIKKDVRVNKLHVQFLDEIIC